jgi:hypothetical protein
MRAWHGREVRRRWWFTIAAMVVLGLAPSFAPSAAAEATTGTESFTIPITPGFITCGGETVFLSGDVHIVFHGTLDASGGVHAVTRANFAGVQGRSESGALYVATDSSMEIFNGKPDAAREDTFERSALLIAQGGLPNVEVHVIGHLTTNANGEVVVDFVNVRFGCQE